ncbi:DUF2510 domain-containing protein [Rhodococcus fascians]|nr:DUF2510 domain-containing protein [Rhodococcus fascians]MBY4140516.1 DUF2510 domain-containing protein [Rhodococcus fascians]MBY4219016.1 DUF2510 domain-containing protein [Rhodococcus fascians]MBY4221968.1 DUF2510 domain-containing protein [Rhodococcus fascians]MBY4233969.1 DUF2510 domain-containing protein [Rhodococcus fascians]
MTSPTPPPGWHPDPGEPGLIRYWDGTRWTEHTQPATGPADEAAATDAAAPGQPDRPGVPRAVKIIGAIVAALVVLGVLGAVLGDDKLADDSQAAAPSTTSNFGAQQTSTPAPSTATPPTTTNVPPATTTTAVAAAPPASATYSSDPRCAPANQSLVDLVASGFSESGLTLTNGTVVDAGYYTYIGGTTVDATGRVENRSDVWVIANGTVYSSTGGARNTTSWPRASAELDISPGDPDVQAVDTCVVDLTR